MHRDLHRHNLRVEVPVDQLVRVGQLLLRQGPVHDGPIGVVVQHAGQPRALECGIDTRRIDGEEARNKEPPGLLELIDDVVRELERQRSRLARLHLHALDAQSTTVDAYEQQVTPTRGTVGLPRRPAEDLLVGVDRDDDRVLQLPTCGEVCEQRREADRLPRERLAALEPQDEPPRDREQALDDQRDGLTDPIQAEVVHRPLEDVDNLAAVLGSHRQPVAQALDKVRRIVEHVAGCSQTHREGVVVEVEPDEPVEGHHPIRHFVKHADRLQTIGLDANPQRRRGAQASVRADSRLVGLVRLDGGATGCVGGRQQGRRAHPGSLPLVVPRRDDGSEQVVEGRETVGPRRERPGHSQTRDVLNDRDVTGPVVSYQ